MSTRQLNRCVAAFVFTVAVGVYGGIAFVACATPTSVAGRSTADLTAPGIRALHATEVVKALDIIRDTAIDGEAAGVVPLATAKAVVTWHTAALRAIAATPNGWKASMLAGLEALKTALPAADAAVFIPYINAAIALIGQVIP